MKIPVMVHHWGRNGASWTSNPALLEHYIIILRALKTLLAYYDREKVLEQVVTAEQFCLAVSAEPDLNCPDPKAKNRNPFIMRVAFLADPNLEVWQDKLPAIFEALKAVVPSPDYDNQEEMLIEI